MYNSANHPPSSHSWNAVSSSPVLLSTRLAVRAATAANIDSMHEPWPSHTNPKHAHNCAHSLRSDQIRYSSPQLQLARFAGSHLYGTSARLMQ